MILDVTADLRNVKIIPSTEIEEVIQNVQMILATQKFSVPMDREFGINLALLDQPIAATQARLSAEIATAIREQEQRARVQKIFYNGDDAADGKLKVSVRIEIAERNLRGGVF